MLDLSAFVVLIRSYNEITRLPEVIDTIRRAGYDRIIVIDDGSTDGTREYLASRSDITTLRHPINRGAGAALETGFSYVRTGCDSADVRYVITFDADGQHDIADMAHFLDAIERYPEVGVFLGSRFLSRDASSNIPCIRRLVLIGGRWFTYAFSGVWLSDSHNGYRVLSIDSIKKIQLTMDGMEYASELVELLVRNDIAFLEVPVTIRYDAYSLAK